MANITILKKGIREAETNQFNTVKLVFSEFEFVNSKEKKQVYVRRRLTPNTEVIVGWLVGSTFKDSIKNKWEAIFSPKGGGMLENISKVLTLAGFGSLKTKFMYNQMWVNIEPVDFTVSMFFETKTDPVEDVIKPIRTLQQLILPDEQEAKFDANDFMGGKENRGKRVSNQTKTNEKSAKELANWMNNSAKALFGTFIVPPPNDGVNIKNILQKKNFVALDYIQIGSFITFRDVVLHNIDVTWDIENCDSRGKPLTADVTISFRSKSVWTANTIKNIQNTNSDIPENQELEVVDVGGIISSGFEVVVNAIKDFFDPSSNSKSALK